MFKNSKRKTGKMAALLMSCVLIGCNVGGCGYEDELALREEYDNEVVNAAEDENEAVEEELEKSAEYERPVIKPRVLVDQTGYQLEDAKKVLFVGEGLENSFSVIDKASGEIIFTDTIQEWGYDKLTDTYVSIGDFSEVKKPGVYYIETAIIGQSYPFSISRHPYEDQYELFLEEVTAGDLSKECKNVMEAADVLANLLFTYEFYGKEQEAAADASGEEGVPPLLKTAAAGIEQMAECQNTADGSVYESFGKRGSVSAASGYAFAAVMAQFSAAYKQYDQSLSYQCLKAAEKAYAYCDKENEESDAKYYAAAQLYKATGTRRYHDWMKLWLSKQDEAEKEEKTDSSVSENGYSETAVSENTVSRQRLYGDVVYLTTVVRVDQNICHDLMEELLDRAEAFAAEAESDYYLVSAGEDRDIDTMLDHMFVFAVADHVIVSHEYLSILKEHIHYLNGRNSSLLEGEYPLSTRAELLFILGNMLHREENFS